MKNLKKGLSILTFAFVMVISLSVVNVNAADYDLATEMGNLLAGNPLTLTAEDSLSYNNEVWFGANGRFTINSGEVTFQYTGGVVNITIDTAVGNSNVTLNEGKQFITQVEVGADKAPVNFTISDSSILSVNGTLVIPSGAESVIVNNGNLNINQSGSFEIRNRANNYQGTGFLNVFGNIVIYGASGDNIGSQQIRLHENANVYSEADILDNLTISKADSDTNTYEIVENTNNTYESVTADIGLREFPYAYTVKAQEVEEIPVTPGKDETTQNNPTEEVSNEKNPETSDGILLFLGLTIVGFAGTALAYRRLHN